MTSKSDVIEVKRQDLDYVLSRIKSGIAQHPEQSAFFLGRLNILVNLKLISLSEFEELTSKLS